MFQQCWWPIALFPHPESAPWLLFLCQARSSTTAQVSEPGSLLLLTHPPYCLASAPGLLSPAWRFSSSPQVSAWPPGSQHLHLYLPQPLTLSLSWEEFPFGVPKLKNLGENRDLFYLCTFSRDGTQDTDFSPGVAGAAREASRCL